MAMKTKKPEVVPNLPPVAGCKSIGTLAKPAYKVWEITQVKAVKAENGVVTIEGYANTKGKPDRYGDIPMVMPRLRNYVYELSQFIKNPVLLMNHRNEVQSIAGSFDVLREDENGLFFKATFSQSDFPPVAHARTVYAEGHGKALSIAGRFYYEDKDNAAHLTYADIFEISLVGVGADPDALGMTDSAEPKAVEAEAEALVLMAEAERKESEAVEKELAKAVSDLDTAVQTAEAMAGMQGLARLMSA